jgi:hypothetical protein
MAELSDAQLPDDPQFRELVGAYRRELEAYMRERGPAPAQFYGWGGTRTNLYSTVSWIGSTLGAPPPFLKARNRVAVALQGYGVPAQTFTEKDRSRLLAAGCIPVSGKTSLTLGTKIREIAARGESPRWYQTRILVGASSGVVGLEHHSVAVYRARGGRNHAENLPDDTPAEQFCREDDFVFDPWIAQTPQIYLFGDWVKQMWVERYTAGKIGTAATGNFRYAMARKDSLAEPLREDFE